MQLIEKSDFNICEIAYLVGIGDPYYFSKLFKRYTGLPPEAYLQRKRAVKRDAPEGKKPA
jgi:YesN/AraC family two-component response regulator